MPKGTGELKIGPIIMNQLVKKPFETYSEAEEWMLTTTDKNDGQVRRERGGGYYVFAEDTSKPS